MTFEAGCRREDKTRCGLGSFAGEGKSGWEEVFQKGSHFILEPRSLPWKLRADQRRKKKDKCQGGKARVG